MIPLPLAWLTPVLLLGSCSQGGRGSLQPIAQDGITLASRNGVSNDTARIERGGVRADVTGNWSNANESIEVVYTASAPAAISIGGGSTWVQATAPASEAWDTTTDVPGNVMGRRVLGKEMRLAGGERRTVLIFYDRPGDADRPGYGDDVSIAVPMPDRPQSVRFRLNSE